MPISNQQNKAIHRYFRLVSEALNEQGLDMKTVLAETQIDIPWTPEAIKENLWKPIQYMTVHKQSTQELESGEIDTVYDTLNRFLAKLGVEQEFPSIDTLQLYDE